jgi:hypothetical protein
VLAILLIVEHRPLRLNAASNGLSGVVLIKNLNGTYKDPNFDLALIRFWLVIKREK